MTPIPRTKRLSRSYTSANPISLFPSDFPRALGFILSPIYQSSRSFSFLFSSRYVEETHADTTSFGSDWNCTLTVSAVEHSDSCRKRGNYLNRVKSSTLRNCCLEIVFPCERLISFPLHHTTSVNGTPRPFSGACATSNLQPESPTRQRDG